MIFNHTVNTLFVNPNFKINKENIFFLSAYDSVVDRIMCLYPVSNTHPREIPHKTQMLCNTVIALPDLSNTIRET